MTETQTVLATDLENDRPTLPALLKGWRRTCPSCGKGAVLHSYLKVKARCDNCDLDLSQARADDGPAYLTILVVGHLLAPLIHLVFVTWRPEPLVLFTIFTIGCVSLSLYLLPRLKGGIIAYQWAKRMYGFEKNS
ncbi:DUF983 domain-containing protein [Parasedimentitalea psychrophila]|uniref:DUF983 domain-containing protein n=1 Tax=Parasedimentitalea psychrophila TaxID=2997337 RepID=A0A9Y2P307_9RHOB|nr:DUF983 domain-containing protein [Parasedimentitalea psychrophila]WIY25592.1 DUF983 domain-containing protein [Parasedimentitalea psychrophila]